MKTQQQEELTIIYTAQIGGDLGYLPRLHTFLQQIKEQENAGTLLLDLGGACREDIWHCAVTGGRSTLIVLDGMGYHAVNVTGFLKKTQYEQVRNSVTMGLVDHEHLWRYHIPPIHDDGIVVAATPAPALSLCILASQADESRIHQRTLSLQSVSKGQVGMLRINLWDQHISECTILDVPTRLKPDPTISASIEFIEEEARFLQKNSKNL